STRKLVSEYQQLELAIQRHQSNPLTPGSAFAIRAARTFRQGLQRAEVALELLTQWSFDGNANISGNSRSVAEELAHVGRAEAAIYRARLEFVALVKGDTDASQEAAFDALEQAAEDDA
ncbi:MAG: hypothetical protein V3T49_09435, partial [Dehalococcoidia bacterium]